MQNVEYLHIYSSRVHTSVVDNNAVILHCVATLLMAYFVHKSLQTTAVLLLMLLLLLQHEHGMTCCVPACITNKSLCTSGL